MSGAVAPHASGRSVSLASIQAPVRSMLDRVTPVMHKLVTDDMPMIEQVAGHLFSKMRFLSAQLDAYLTDGLWLRLARHANVMADRLAAGLSAVVDVKVR